jgi:N-methylhydantoinase A
VSKLRLGIDVGGTFTDVVAIDAVTRELVARVKVPTTHDAPEGVAAGIVDGIERLLAESNVAPGDVAFIAHSTTQATNALLEGDVARVGVLGLLGAGAWFARRQMTFAPVALAPGLHFTPVFAFAKASDGAAIHAAVDDLLARDVEAVATSQAFGVDHPAAENAAAEYARERGADATSGHDVSTTYGLRARTRTAALNAAILPRMIRTSQMTAAAVERAAIAAPLMIMRSDGGVMDVREIERRPILTLLSGPAAGVAGALLYDNVSDGIFVEVGGTSSDCSAIRAGRPQMRAAKIGGHRAMLRTLDVRTLGIAGGSMAKIAGGAVVDVGPRSAHIAGCVYACFADPALADGARVDEESEYAVVVARDGTRIAVTPSCAANLLGAVPSDAFARGNVESARAAFALLAQRHGGDAESLARQLLDIAARKLRAGIDDLIADYALDRTHVVVVGGGGGAGAIVPHAAETMGLPWRIARDAEVISPIGVALALVRDVVERIIVNPSPKEIARIRREAADRVVAAGASPERVEVQVEIDSQRNLVRATASGATEIAESAALPAATEAERRAAAARSMRCEPGQLRDVELTGRLYGYEHAPDVRVVDERGVVRLSLRSAVIERAAAENLEARVTQAIEAGTRFGDVGRAIPAVYLLRGARVAAFEGLASREQGVALACEEIEGCDGSEIVALITVPNLSG